MDFLRAPHDAQLIGANTLREELNPEGGGWDYAINDKELRQLWGEFLRRHVTSDLTGREGGGH